MFRDDEEDALPAIGPELVALSSANENVKEVKRQPSRRNPALHLNERISAGSVIEPGSVTGSVLLKRFLILVEVPDG